MYGDVVPDYLDVRDRTQSFDGILAFVHETVGLTTTAGELPRVRFATFVSTNFFRVLTIEPQVGRGFLADEDGKARPDTVAVLSDAFWRGQFAADPNILGRTIRVSGVEVTIIGVAPASFSGLDRYLPDEVFLPVTMLPRVGNVPTPGVLDARDARSWSRRAACGPASPSTRPMSIAGPRRTGGPRARPRAAASGDEFAPDASRANRARLSGHPPAARSLARHHLDDALDRGVVRGLRQRRGPSREPRARTSA